MATNEKLKNQLQSQNNQPTKVSAKDLGLKGLLAAPTLKKKFEEVLNNKAPQFMASLLNLYSNDAYLQKAEPMSIVASAMVAASLDLPVDKNLGYAWIVPYSGKAQFQLGYKGYIQLALRTGQYKAINVIEVYEGELVNWNRLTEELELDLDGATSEKIVGYCGYFKLVNGFEKTVYWSKDKIEKHKNRFSKSDFGWKKDWDAMAKKTVLRNMLSKWGILSIDMQMAMTKDETVREINDPSSNEDIIDVESHVEEVPQQEQKQNDQEMKSIHIDDKDLPF